MEEKKKVEQWFKEQLSMCIEESLDAIECEDIMHICLKAFEELKALKEKNETLKALYEDAKKEGNHLIAKERAKAIDDVFDYLKTQRKGIYMRVDFDDLEIRQYKEQLLKTGGKSGLEQSK